ncbi:MAG: ATP:cob(I)alamin adenosyltransferase [Myxococcota bacterium]
MIHRLRAASLLVALAGLAGSLGCKKTGPDTGADSQDTDATTACRFCGAPVGDSIRADWWCEQNEWSVPGEWTPRTWTDPEGNETAEPKRADPDDTDGFPDTLSYGLSFLDNREHILGIITTRRVPPNGAIDGQSDERIPLTDVRIGDPGPPWQFDVDDERSPWTLECIELRAPEPEVELVGWPIHLECRWADGWTVVMGPVAQLEECPSLPENEPRSAVARFEELCDTLNEDLGPLKDFILPGGGPVGAFLHQARTVCRRAERRLVTALQGDDSINEGCLRFLNRLSDFLFILARWANKMIGEPEFLWEKPAI